MNETNKRVHKLKSMLKLLRTEQMATGMPVYFNTIRQYEEELNQLQKDKIYR